MVAAAVDLTTIAPDGVLDRHFHEGQWRALHSDKRFILVLAGTQSGKTSFGPHWLLQEMIRCGAGDYMVVTPTFPLLEVKALPEFRRLFVDTLALGTYQSSPVRQFRLSDAGAMRLWGHVPTEPTVVYFGYAADPDSLESATIKGLWADEAGQKAFKRESWEALLRRLSLNISRALLTTTPYHMGWLKTTFWDPWTAAHGDHPEIDVINFPSIANPRFPRQEFERARRDLPPWKFRMFYEGRFERPAGMIYDSFTEAHVVPDFAVPADWPRTFGLDFGGVNTAAICLAAERTPRVRPDDPPGDLTGRWFAYREYHRGGRTASQHAEAILAGEPRVPRCIGGSKSEGQWRNEFSAGGLPISPPDVADVEIGINRVYGAFARSELLVMQSLSGLRDQLGRYSRVLGPDGEPTEAIEDKETFHLLDALRYAGTSCWSGLSDGSLVV